MISRKLKPGEVRHTELLSGKRRIRLITVMVPDGWLAGVSEIGGQDWEELGVWPNLKSAVDQLESYARHALNNPGPIQWSSDPP